MPINMEFKARVPSLSQARSWLHAQQAHFVGIDEQIDTYFHVPSGRLKLRSGPIENALIYYQRAEEAPIKRSDVWLYPISDGHTLKKLLTACLGVLVEVRKKREIYFIGQSKFHLDEVAELGYFIEVEVIVQNASEDMHQTAELAAHYQQQLHIQPDQLIQASYADLLLNNRSPYL
ncbi:MAG: class IV adenylate cyclase [Thermoflavifilum sp.]|nr:class IV adenylate cyclase [Thermoflavifilum sp.]